RPAVVEVEVADDPRGGLLADGGPVGEAPGLVEVPALEPDRRADPQGGRVKLEGEPVGDLLSIAVRAVDVVDPVVRPPHQPPGGDEVAPGAAHARMLALEERDAVRDLCLRVLAKRLADPVSALHELD